MAAPLVIAASTAGFSASETSPRDSASKAALPATEPASPPSELPAHTTVLHVGDSFAESLGAPLGRRLQALGIRQVLESKTPSYIPTWAGNGELKRYLAKHKPDLVLVTLGGNEFEVPTPTDRIDPVKRLVALLAGRPCVWITPPRWKSDTGILAVIRDNSSPCRYLDSDTITHDLPRARDKIHPSEAGREAWAEAVLAWLKAERAPEAEHPWALKP